MDTCTYYDQRLVIMSKATQSHTTEATLISMAMAHHHLMNQPLNHRDTAYQTNFCEQAHTHVCACIDGILASQQDAHLQS